jgi:hypothetical protein
MIGLDEKGTIALREKVAGGRIAAQLANVPQCLIGKHGNALNLSNLIVTCKKLRHFANWHLFQTWACSAEILRREHGERD